MKEGWRTEKERLKERVRVLDYIGEKRRERKERVWSGLLCRFGLLRSSRDHGSRITDGDELLDLIAG